MKCQWCGVDFEKRPHIPRRQWDNQWQCKAIFACAERRRRKAKK